MAAYDIPKLGILTEEESRGSMAMQENPCPEELRDESCGVHRGVEGRRVQ